MNAVSGASGTEPIVVKQIPRRKFNINSEIKLALRRYSLLKQSDTDWMIKLDRSIVRKIMDAYHTKFLYVYGISDKYIEQQLPQMLRGELLEYLKVLPIPALEQPQIGGKLKWAPLFSAKFPQSTSLNIRETYHKPMPIEKLTSNYFMYEQAHKDTENHHPDGKGWNKNIINTIECVFDVFNSLLRTNTLNSAYNKLFNILLSKKFDNLDNNGIYFAFLHMSIRGVSMSEFLYRTGNWRRETIPQQTLFKYSMDFANGIPPNHIVVSYKYETICHSMSLRSEMRRLRAPNANKHDYTKFQPGYLSAYAWYWGVYNKLTKTNQYRLDSGMIYPSEDLGVCNPTMFSLGSGIGEGIVHSEAVKEVVGLIKQLPEKISEKLDIGLDKFSGEINKQRVELKQDVSEFSQSFSKLNEQTGKTLIDEIVVKSEAIGKNLSKSFEPMMEAMSALSSMVDSIIKKVLSFLEPFPGFSGLNINLKSMLDSLTYYVLYINTESTAIKTILIVLILNGLGLLQTAYNEILNFWSWTQNSANIDGETVSVNETSSVFDWLISSPKCIVTIVAGIIANMVKGIPLTPKEFLSLSKKLADNLKNFHFISQGIGGITKLFEYFKKAFQVVMDWISLHIFGRTPEKEELAKKCIKLAVKVKYFHTESGLNAIRMSEPVREKAGQLLAEYLALQAELKLKGADYRHLYNDLEKINRQVKEVSDFVTRLKNISNFQPTMFHIQLVGRPGIGKSTITKNVVSDLSKTLWPEESKPSFYSYNTDLEYFDGYAGQKIMIVDDLYKINDPKHLTASMFLVTNTPVILPMANLNDKGVQLTSEVLISSTNTAYPIGKDVLCMEAIHRRRHMLVEVICDPDVLDKSLGQFSISLYKKKYKMAELSSFPHLTFNLLRPVPEEFGGAMTVDTDEFETYRNYANKLKEANMYISMGSDKVDPTYYFSEENQPPQGIHLPVVGWTYKQLISNCSVRFSAFRGTEGTYSTSRKYAHVEACLTEIDALLDQSQDIEDGEEIPINEIIKSLLCRAQHPFGTTDDFGSILNELRSEASSSRTSESGISPDLDNIDLDKLVEDIINGRPSPTGLDLTEEQERTRRILNRKGKRIIDPALRDQLKIVEIGGKRMIPIISHFTSWFEVPTYERGNLGATYMSFISQCGMGEIKFSKLESIVDPSAMRILYEILKGLSQEGVKTVNNYLRWLLSSEMIYPDDESFGEKRGTPTGFPVSFFRDLRKVGSQWYLDVENLEFSKDLSHIKQRVVAFSGGPEYEVPVDLAFMLSTMASFRDFANEFDALSSAQQDRLVYDSKWRSQYFEGYTYDRISEQFESIFAKCGLKALHYLTSPIRIITEKYPIIISVLGYILAYITIIFCVTKISELFSPKPTSKYLHRSQIPQTAIHLSGRPTSYPDTAYNALVQAATSALNRNVREMVISNTYGGCKVQCLLSEQYIIFNRHAMKVLYNKRSNKLEDTEISIAIQSQNSDRQYVKYIINPCNIIEDPDGDLAIMFSKSFPAARSISKMLISDDEFENHDFPEDLVFLTNTVESGTMMDHHPFLKKLKDLYLENNRTKCQSRLAKAVMVKGSTMMGRSGSTVFTSLQNKPKIVGIQAWEVDVLMSPKVAIQVVTAENYSKLVNLLHTQLGERAVQRVFEPEEIDHSSFGQCSETSLAAFEQIPENYLICTDQNSVGVVAKSQIKPSIIYDDLVDDAPAYVPAALHPRDSRLFHGTKIHPLSHSLGKYFRGNIEPFSPILLDYCCNKISYHISMTLDKKNFKILTFEESITGTREDGSNPMNLSSSPGIPFIFENRVKKGKKDYMEIDESGSVSYVDPEFYQGYEKFLDMLSTRNVPYTRAYDFPKDELRPFNKALGTLDQPPKTRSVTCMNVYYILAWRQITLDFWAAMHRAADGTFPFCPGINPEGPEWNNLYHTLNKFPNAVDFDVSNWDGYLRSELFYAAVKVVKLNSKLSQYYNNIIDSISYEVMNSYIQYSNVIYRKDRGLISGFPGTAEINSVSHWLLIFYIYMILTKGTIYNNYEAFLQNVALAVYGDDIILTFSDEIKPLFNGVTISNAYKSIGYPVTSATKDLNIQISKPLLDCSFLKSTWRELVPFYYIRKMDTQVLYNLVTWNRCKQDPVTQFYENYLDALRIAFGNGEETFYNFRDHINNILMRNGRDIISFDYLDFLRDYYDRYLPNYTKNMYNY